MKHFLPYYSFWVWQLIKIQSMPSTKMALSFLLILRQWSQCRGLGLGSFQWRPTNTSVAKTHHQHRAKESCALCLRWQLNIPSFNSKENLIGAVCNARLLEVRAAPAVWISWKPHYGWTCSSSASSASVLAVWRDNFQKARWIKKSLETQLGPSKTNRVSPQNDDAQRIQRDDLSHNWCHPKIDCIVFPRCYRWYLVKMSRFPTIFYLFWACYNPTMLGSHLTQWHVESNEIRTVRLALYMATTWRLAAKSDACQLKKWWTPKTCQKLSCTVRAQMFQYKESTI